MVAKYMKRCLELARKGRSSVAPNPMVGAVVVYNDKIIGEGYHRKYGESHAEVHAIHRVEDKSLLEKSTLYVNLEPCSHTCTWIHNQNGFRYAWRINRPL